MIRDLEYPARRQKNKKNKDFKLCNENSLRDMRVKLKASSE